MNAGYLHCKNSEEATDAKNRKNQKLTSKKLSIIWRGSSVVERQTHMQSTMSVEPSGNDETSRGREFNPRPRQSFYLSNLTEKLPY